VRYRPDPDEYREMKYKVSPERYAEMVAVGCGICGANESEDGRRLAVDHDHACCPGPWVCGRCVRWVLCERHNRLVGQYEHNRLTDPRLIEMCQNYLAVHGTSGPETIDLIERSTRLPDQRARS
jgi:hypothetical protein